jgi:hypothetical protein
MFGKKKNVDITVQMGEVNVNPTSSTQRHRNEERIKHLELAMKNPKHMGDELMEKELRKRKLIAEVYKIDEEE